MTDKIKDYWVMYGYPVLYWIALGLLVGLGFLVYFGVIAPGLWAMLDPSPAEYLKESRQWGPMLCAGVLNG